MLGQHWIKVAPINSQWLAQSVANGWPNIEPISRIMLGQWRQTNVGQRMAVHWASVGPTHTYYLGDFIIIYFIALFYPSNFTESAEVIKQRLHDYASTHVFYQLQRLPSL
jgi:hypothetical protein